ncbi:hypothetical protein [Nocardiopsis sp. LOL_012]|uniref:hypothetical protein n=1 Tax=Nocardiopsis sp. LOL_012 TaxID=3345409 RepID=UPI003A8833CA
MADHDTREEVARRLAEAASGFPDVVELSAGSFGTISTPARGGVVRGVAVRQAGVEVGLVVRFGRPIPAIAEDVRYGLAPLAGGQEVHVFVEDVVAGLGGG